MQGPAGLESCHVPFVRDSEQRRISLVLRELVGKSVVTASGSENFVQRGGMIELGRSGSQVRFEVSGIAIERSQLKVGPRLLTLAANVHGER